MITRRNFLQTGAAAALTPLFLSRSAAGAQPKELPADEFYANYASSDRLYKGAVFLDGPPPPTPKGAFTLAVLPDTQEYARRFPYQFHMQTQWIVDHREERNIVGVLQLGDITNNNTPEQWEHARAAFKRLDGQVPYFLTLGNHDYGPNGGTADRTTLFNEYFPLSVYRNKPGFGGVYDREPDRFENNYHYFSAGGQDFLVLSLEFGPRNDVVRWANEVVARHPRHAVILITHAYMYYDDTRYDFKKWGSAQRWSPHNYPIGKNGGDVNDGEELWEKLVSRHDNFIMTLNGHVLEDGLGRISTPGSAGQDVHQMLVNFQTKPNGGDAWMRLLEFQPDGTTVEIYDYSPLRDQTNQSPQNRFALTIKR